MNYFRDVCPNLLPKKLRGRFTKVDEDNKKENFVYGKQKINYNIDGIDLLMKSEKTEEGVNLAATRILTEDDLKKIRYLKMRRAVKKVDRKGFASSDEEEDELEKKVADALAAEEGSGSDNEDDFEDISDLSGEEMEEGSDEDEEGDSDMEEGSDEGEEESDDGEGMNGGNEDGAAMLKRALAEEGSNSDSDIRAS